MTNGGDTEVVGILAVISASPTSGWVTLPSPPYISPTFDLGAGGHKDIQYAVTCIGTGEGNITVTASGTSPTGAVSGDDYVTISQQAVIAALSPASDLVALPESVNKCQEFDVTFRYYNYSDFNHNWGNTTGNITACINFEGNAELMSAQIRKITGGVPVETFHPYALSGPGNECVNIPSICGCCAEDIKWHFKCTDIGEVYINSTLTVQQPTATYPFEGNDTSETVCVTQEYKAHLTADALFFVQDDHGIMTEQDAVVPGNDFHVVIPVINTGNAWAEDAQVYITITDQPEGNCSGSVASYDFIGYSGDGTAQVVSNVVDPVHGRTVVLIASLGDIPGINQYGTCQNNVRKAILLLHCRCEGHVSVWIPDQVADWGGVKGIRAFDSNTDALVLQDNIVIPPCPEVIEQIPFRVEILNPQTCQTFAQYDTFAVKARITNDSTEELDNIWATLHWGSMDPVELLPGNATDPSGSQNNPKFFGNLTQGNSGEITWELRCTGEGEVELWVTAATAVPNLAVTSDSVTVHQTQPPGACLIVTILSPDGWHHGQDWDVGSKHAMIATGQQFAVTAKVENDGPGIAENVIVTIDPIGCDSLHYVTLVDPIDRGAGPLHDT